MKELTKHGYKRIKERMGIKSESKARRQVTLAFERGLDRKVVNGKIARMIDFVMRCSSSRDVVVKIYDGGLYIFGHDDVLITCWMLDSDVARRCLACSKKLKGNESFDDLLVA